MNRLAQASSKVDRERLLLNTLTLTRESSIDVRPFSVRLSLHGDLDFFLPSRTRRKDITRSLSEKTSVKDVIESCGVPHPEVDLIVVNGEEVDFDYGVMNDAEIEVYPPELQSPQPRKKRLQVLTISRFVTDGHLGKLTRNLRLLGFDVAYDPRAHDRQLLDIMDRENRALLTRDRRLLMHAVVRTAYCPRSHDPNEQTVQVIRRFNLFELIAPFSRCLRCNAPLREITKADIIEELEPLTKIYYEQFWRCTGCGQIYWPGSHFPRLQKRLEKIRANVRG
jgi:uncharacterized protein with PIN domain